MRLALTCLLILAPLAGCQRSDAASQDRSADKGEKTVKAPKGVVLEDLTWLEAEKTLTADAVVVIPLGARSKEHGPHLKLNNDFLMAEYFKRRVLAADPAVMAPTVGFHYYPAFVEYPGSIHLRLETARDLIIDIVKSLAAYGPRRFYVLNTGVSTLRPLKASAEALARDGILLTYTNIITASKEARNAVETQKGGTHADEIETSMMLYIAPESVDMSKAVDEYNPAPGKLTRQKDLPNCSYSASGVYGSPTLATRAKGQVVVEATLAAILADLAALRAAPLPK